MLNDYFEIVRDINSLENATLVIIRNLLTSLDCFYVRFVRYTPNIVKALEDNHAKLENVNIWLDSDYNDLVKAQFREIKKSRQIQHIKSITVMKPMEDLRAEETVLSRVLIGLCKSTVHLVKVKIGILKFKAQLLFGILQNLPSLENFMFDGVFLDEDDRNVNLLQSISKI
jgi:hypothetical protein